MATKTVLSLAASTIIISSVLVSCSTMKSSKVARASDNPAVAQKSDIKSLSNAEAAVFKDPRNAELRLVLGKIYQANGRFASAEQSYADAIALGNTSSKAYISLALMQIAQGKSEQARSLLTLNRQHIPAADYGLAIALAGDASTGVDTLVELIRSGENTAAIRQNLAMAYALDGRWRESKIMAQQDLDAAVAEERVRQWSALASNESYSERVAAVIGVTPASDPGQPAQLALIPTAGSQSASADSESYAGAPLIRAEDRPVKIASSSDSLPALASRSQPAPAAQAPRFVSNPVVQPVPQRQVQTTSRAPIVEKAGSSGTAGASRKAPIIEKVGAARSAVASNKSVPSAGEKVPAGSYVVQLGAYDSAAIAREKWGNLSRRYGELKNYANASSRAEVRGKTYYRLAAIGFDSKAEADRLCRSIKSRGGNCLIRQVPSGSNIRVASR